MGQYDFGVPLPIAIWKGRFYYSRAYCPPLEGVGGGTPTLPTQPLYKHKTNHYGYNRNLKHAAKHCRRTQSEACLVNNQLDSGKMN